MTNEMILTNREEKVNKFFTLLTTAVERPVNALTIFYNKVLERELNTKQTLWLLNAQVAFIATVFPVECHFLLRLTCAVWLIKALLKCKEEL